MVAVLLSCAMCFAFVGCDSDVKTKDSDDEKKEETTARDVADAYLKSEFIDFDAQKAIGLMHPDYVDYACEEAGVTVDELIESTQNNYDSIVNHFDSSYDSWEFDYEITDENDLDDDEYEDVSEYYSENLDIEIEDAKKFDYESKAICETDGQEETKTSGGIIYVVKVDGKWYYQTEKVD